MSEEGKTETQNAAGQPRSSKKRGVSGPVPFGPYRLLNLLGQGGMGRVYRAVRYGDEGGEEELALKILDRRATSTSAQVRALVDEVRLGQLLRHPNIVRTDELRKVGDSYCIAMEFIDGWPLDRMIELHRKQGQPIPLVTVLELMMMITEALGYAHDLRDENGSHLSLVHRDLKPGNVMVCRSGTIKLMDFGTAKSSANLYQTEDGEARGTPLYMSPEQVMGDDLDHRSDIFSLGSILYELIMLQPCFKGSNLVMVMRNVADAELEEQSEDIAAAAAALQPIFLRCMQAKPKNRFNSVQELAEELKELHLSRPPGPSIQAWLATLAGKTPDTSTGDFGPVSVPGEEALKLPTGNIEHLDTSELQTARLVEAAREDESLSDTLDPESAKTQVLSTTSTPAGHGPKPSEPAAVPNQIEEPPLTPTAATPQPVPVQSPDHSESVGGSSSAVEANHAAEPRPRPPQRSPRKRRRRAKPRRAATWLIWLKALFPVLLILVAFAALLPLLPEHTRTALMERTQDIVNGIWPAGEAPSALLSDNTGTDSASLLETVAHIKAGALRLGPPAGEAGASPSKHPIEIPQFDMMVFEVSVADFEHWCNGKAGKKLCNWKGPQSWQDPRHPAVAVSWNEAMAFCKQWGGRLPTESEWELAARGTDGRRYPWGEDWSAGKANYCDLGCDSPFLPSSYEDDGIPHTAAIDRLAGGASPEGILHLADNVSEWTLDCWTAGHARRLDWRSGTSSCQLRVKRGGSWKQPLAALAGWHRGSMRSDGRSTQVGFRCVRGRDPS
ncbi:MAG: hypothetical protein CMP23_03460 [Rickettsiales bacterium]|nr:hypothetical protein [Rickettsiales bacterium]